VAAEVVGEVLDAALGGAGLQGRDQRREQARLGFAKAVDALLHVTDHEAVGAAGLRARHQPQDFHLHRAGVLVLVDEDVFVAALQAASDVGGRAFVASGRAAEEIQGHAQHVPEFVLGRRTFRRGQQLLVARLEAQQRLGQCRGLLCTREDGIDDVRFPAVFQALLEPALTHLGDAGRFGRGVLSLAPTANFEVLDQLDDGGQRARVV